MSFINKIWFTVPLLFCISLSVAQKKHILRQDTVYLEVFDVYGLQVEVDRLLLIDKCYCGEIKKRGKCSLYQVKVHKVYFARDTSIFSSKQSVEEIRHILTDAKKSLEVGKMYYITAYNSTVTDYIIVNKMFEKEVFFDVNRLLAHQAGLIECHEITVVQKIFMFFGKKTEAVFKKAKKRNTNENQFLRKIQSTNS